MIESATMQELWMQRFRDIVRKEASALGSLRAAYRDIANRVHRNEEYIYQLYAKPIKSDGTSRRISSNLATVLSREYADGRDPMWIFEPEHTPAPAVMHVSERPAQALYASPTKQNEWPFVRVSRERINALSPRALAEVDTYLDAMVRVWESNPPTR